MATSTKPDEFYQFVLLCLDRRTGRELWRKVVARGSSARRHLCRQRHVRLNIARDRRQRIYAFFGSRGLYCFDMQGKLKWEKDLGKMQIRLAFGEGSSPALFGNTLVVNWDHEEANRSSSPSTSKRAKNCGERRRDEKTSWTTPLIVRHARRTTPSHHAGHAKIRQLRFG